MTTKNIAASGGDYTTLSAWWASLASTLSAPQIANCVNDFGGSGLLEASGVAFTGVTTSATNTVTIQGNGLTGVAGGGFFVTSNSGSGGTIRFNENYITLLSLEVTAAGSDSPVVANGNPIQISSCLIHNTAGNTVSAGGAGTITITNSIIYASGANRCVDARSFAAAVFQYDTVYAQGPDYTILCHSESTLTDTYSGGATTSCFTTDGGAVGSYCGSSDSSASGTGFSNGTTSATGSAQFTSVTSGSEDFHLKGTAALLGAATNISGITTDIIGTTRPQSGAYDIGAFEYISAAPPSNKLLLSHPIP